MCGSGFKGLGFRVSGFRRRVHGEFVCFDGKYCYRDITANMAIKAIAVIIVGLLFCLVMVIENLVIVIVSCLKEQ